MDVIEMAAFEPEKTIYFDNLSDPTVPQTTRVQTHIQEWTDMENPEYSNQVRATIAIINSVPVKFGCVYDLITPLRIRNEHIKRAYILKLEEIYKNILGSANVNLYYSIKFPIIKNRHISKLSVSNEDARLFILKFNVKNEDGTGTYRYVQNTFGYYEDENGKNVLSQADPKLDENGEKIIMTLDLTNDTNSTLAKDFKYLELVDPNHSGKTGGGSSLASGGGNSLASGGGNGNIWRFNGGKRRRNTKRRNTKRRKTRRRRRQ